MTALALFWATVFDRVQNKEPNPGKVMFFSESSYRQESKCHNHKDSQKFAR